MEIFQDHLRVLLGDDARISKEEHEQALAAVKRAFVERDGLAVKIEMVVTLLQKMLIEIEFATVEAEALNELVAKLQADLKSARADLKRQDWVSQEKLYPKDKENLLPSEAKPVGVDKENEIENLKRDLSVLKRRFEKEEKLAAERGADIEDLKEQLQALQLANRRYTLEVSEAEKREKSLRDELKNETEGGWAKSALLNEYEEKSRKGTHTIKAAIEKIYSVLVSYDTVAVEAVQHGGINRRDAKSESVLLNEVELKVNLFEKGEHEIQEDAALLVRADQAFAKAEELQTRLKDAKKSVEERDKKVADLQRALREAEHNTVNAKQDIRHLEDQIRQYKERETETRAPRGVCNCMG